MWKLSRCRVVRPVVLVCTIFASAPAFGASPDWWMLAGDTMQCRRAAEVAQEAKVPSMLSPAALTNFLKKAGIYGDTFITDDKVGDAAVVEVWTSKGGRFVYFPNGPYCEAWIKVFVGRAGEKLP
jgi:hypothetical protein